MPIPRRGSTRSAKVWGEISVAAALMTELPTRPWNAQAPAQREGNNHGGTQICLACPESKSPHRQIDLAVRRDLGDQPPGPRTAWLALAVEGGRARRPRLNAERLRLSETVFGCAGN